MEVFRENFNPGLITPETKTGMIENSPPMAKFLIEHFNRLALENNIQPLTSDKWKSIEHKNKSLFWPHQMVLKVRTIDETGLTPNLFGIYDNDSQAIRREINSLCLDEFNKVPDLLRPRIYEFLLEQCTEELASHFRVTLSALDELAASVNGRLGNTLTSEGQLLHNEVEASVFKDSSYTEEEIIQRVVNPELYKDIPLIPPFKFIPEVDRNGIVVGMKQQYKLTPLPENTLKKLRQITAEEFLSKTPDPKNPTDEDFLARRLLRAGNPLFRIIEQATREISSAETKHMFNIFSQQRERFPIPSPKQIREE